MKDIPGLDGRYAVNEAGEVYSRVSKRWLKHWLVNGYPMVALGSTRRKRLVHLLVLQTFVGACPEGQEARHLNGDRCDPSLSNLCYGTKQENAADRDAHGTTARGERVGGAKLTTEQVLAIREDPRTLKQIAADYGVHFSLVSLIRKRKVWAHV